MRLRPAPSYTHPENAECWPAGRKSARYCCNVMDRDRRHTALPAIAIAAAIAAGSRQRGCPCGSSLSTYHNGELVLFDVAPLFDDCDLIVGRRQ